MERVHSEETKAKMRFAQSLRDKAGYIKTPEHRAKVSKTLGHKVEILDVETNTTVMLDTIGEAAEYLGSSHTTISRYITNQTLFKDKYRIIKLSQK